VTPPVAAKWSVRGRRAICAADVVAGGGLGVRDSLIWRSARDRVLESVCLLGIRRLALHRGTWSRPGG
jgi:hypothetical protein